MDGCIDHTCTLTHSLPDLFSCDLVKNKLLLGHVMCVSDMGAATGVWKLGNVMLFSGKTKITFVCTYSIFYHISFSLIQLFHCVYCLYRNLFRSGAQLPPILPWPRLYGVASV